MTPFKDNITKSIDNLNKLQEDVENTITDLQEQIEDMENLETKDVTITTNTETTIEPTTGKYALDKVVVTTNVQPNLEEKSVTITENTTTNITPSSGYDGLSSVAVTTNIASLKIKDGRRLFARGARLLTFDDYINCLDLENNAEYIFADVGSYGSQAEKTKLESIDFSNINVSKINNLNHAFSYNNNMTTYININNWNTSSINNISNMFENNTNLSDIDISNWDLSALTTTNSQYFQYIFTGCPNLNNDSLHSILKALLTIDNTKISSSYRKLSYLGLLSTQATTCTSFDEWSTLSANGWTTGY